MSIALIWACISVHKDILVPSLAPTRRSDEAQLRIDLNEMYYVKYVSLTFFLKSCYCNSNIISTVLKPSLILISWFTFVLILQLVW